MTKHIDPELHDPLLDRLRAMRPADADPRLDPTGPDAERVLRRLVDEEPTTFAPARRARMRPNRRFAVGLCALAGAAGISITLASLPTDDEHRTPLSPTEARAAALHGLRTHDPASANHATFESVTTEAGVTTSLRIVRDGDDFELTTKHDEPGDGRIDPAENESLLFADDLAYQRRPAQLDGTTDDPWVLIANRSRGRTSLPGLPDGKRLADLLERIGDIETTVDGDGAVTLRTSARALQLAPAMGVSLPNLGENGEFANDPIGDAAIELVARDAHDAVLDIEVRLDARYRLTGWHIEADLPVGTKLVDGDGSVTKTATATRTDARISYRDDRVVIPRVSDVTIAAQVWSAGASGEVSDRWRAFGPLAGLDEDELRTKLDVASKWADDELLEEADLLDLPPDDHALEPANPFKGKTAAKLFADDRCTVIDPDTARPLVRPDVAPALDEVTWQCQLGPGTESTWTRTRPMEGSPAWWSWTGVVAP